MFNSKRSVLFAFVFCALGLTCVQVYAMKNVEDRKDDKPKIDVYFESIHVSNGHIDIVVDKNKKNIRYVIDFHKIITPAILKHINGDNKGAVALLDEAIADVEKLAFITTSPDYVAPYHRITAIHNNSPKIFNRIKQCLVTLKQQLRNLPAITSASNLHDYLYRLLTELEINDTHDIKDTNPIKIIIEWIDLVDILEIDNDGFWNATVTGVGERVTSELRNNINNMMKVLKQIHEKCNTTLILANIKNISDKKIQEILYQKFDKALEEGVRII